MYVYLVIHRYTIRRNIMYVTRSVIIYTYIHADACMHNIYVHNVSTCFDSIAICDYICRFVHKYVHPNISEYTCTSCTAYHMHMDIASQMIMELGLNSTSSANNSKKKTYVASTGHLLSQEKER